MKFKLLSLVDGVVNAEAEGHPTDVIEAFREVCHHLLSGLGPWRITNVSGAMPNEDVLNSEMEWSLTAALKDEHKSYIHPPAHE